MAASDRERSCMQSRRRHRVEVCVSTRWVRMAQHNRINASLLIGLLDHAPIALGDRG